LKIANFVYPRVFCAPAEGFPLELGTGAGGQKTRMMGLPGRERRLTISSAVWIQYTNVTDGQIDTGRQQRPRICLVLHGKNEPTYLKICVLRYTTNNENNFRHNNHSQITRVNNRMHNFCSLAQK